jgi:hypothetical protein
MVNLTTLPIAQMCWIISEELIGGMWKKAIVAQFYVGCCP